jgi:beta-glucosidase
VKYGDVSSSKNFPGKVIAQQQPQATGERGFMRGQPAVVTYEEGIYTGYRYFSTFNVPVSYEFGYGLSFTKFEYSNLKLSSANFSKNITVSVTVKNTGTVAGKEIVQLYLKAPGIALDKPSCELKGFTKTGLLQPGGSQVVNINIDAGSLASFDPSASAWIAEAGKYDVLIGASVNDIRLNGTFKLAKALTVKKETKALLPKEKINELKPVK